MPEYAFDAKLFAAIRVEADSEDEARKKLEENADCMDCNGGAWPDGSPILFEASVELPEASRVFEVDGVEVDTPSIQQRAKQERTHGQKAPSEPTGTSVNLSECACPFCRTRFVVEVMDAVAQHSAAQGYENMFAYLSDVESFAFEVAAFLAYANGFSESDMQAVAKVAFQSVSRVMNTDAEAVKQAGHAIH